MQKNHEPINYDELHSPEVEAQIEDELNLLYSIMPRKKGETYTGPMPPLPTLQGPKVDRTRDEINEKQLKIARDKELVAKRPADTRSVWTLDDWMDPTPDDQKR
jgi:hypothetical protein